MKKFISKIWNSSPVRFVRKIGKRIWFSLAMLVGGLIYLYGAVLIEVWTGEKDEEDWRFWR